MALSDSNTFVLPSQGASIAVSRSQFNNSLKAVLSNFYSDATPDSENLVEGGSSLSATEYDGMFYRSSDTGVVYISDSAITVASGRTNRPIGGNFTRYGIAWRQQGSLAAAAANISDFDVGEAFAIVKDTEGSSNNSVWLRVATTGTFASDWINLRTPQSDTVATGLIQDQAITGPKLNASMTAIPTTVMEHTSAVTITPRIVVSSFANNQTIATSAAIELKTATVTNDVALGFNNGSKNASIKMIPGDTGNTDRGVGVYTTADDLAPIRANLVMQSAITGTTTESTAAPLLPAGVTVAWPASTAPEGWVLCTGQALSRTTYASLYGACGTTFGPGDGSTTFNVPDLRGRAIYGTSTGTINLGTKTTGISSSFTNTTDSHSGHVHTSTTTNVTSTTDKDAAVAVAVATSPTNSGGAHTHTVTFPGISMNYIIKT